jgi:hypothetical protein
MPQTPLLSTLQTALAQEASKLPYRGCLIFQPLEDASYGHFCSPLAFEASAQLRLPVEDCAKQLADALQPALALAGEKLELECVRGFLNFRAKSPAGLLGELFTDQSPTKTAALPDCGLPTTDAVALLVPGPCHELTILSSIRLLSAALVQACLLRSFGASTRLLYAGKEIDLAQPAQSFALALAQALEKDSQRSAMATYCEELLAPAEQLRQSFRLWLSPHWLKDAYLKPYRALLDTEHRPSAGIYAPHKDWLNCDPNLGTVNATAIKQLLNWPQAQLGNLLLYLAGPSLGTELDLAVPRLEERGNLLWYLRSTLPRLQRALGACPAAPLAESSIQHTGTSAALCSTILRSCFYPAHAAWNSKISSYLAALSETLTEINAWLNQPGLRLRASQCKLIECKLEPEETFTHWAVHCYLVRAISVLEGLDSSSKAQD